MDGNTVVVGIFEDRYQAEQAVDELEQAILHDPRESRAHYVLGVVTQRLGRTQEARTELEAFLGLAPSRYVPEIADAKTRLKQLH